MDYLLGPKRWPLKGGGHYREIAVSGGSTVILIKLELLNFKSVMIWI